MISFNYDRNHFYLLYDKNNSFDNKKLKKDLNKINLNTKKVVNIDGFK